MARIAPCWDWSSAGNFQLRSPHGGVGASSFDPEGGDALKLGRKVLRKWKIYEHMSVIQSDSAGLTHQKHGFWTVYRGSPMRNGGLLDFFRWNRVLS